MKETPTVFATNDMSCESCIYARKVDMGDDVSTKWRDNACPAPVGGVIHLSRQETRILTVLIKRQVGMKVVLATTYDVSTNSS